MATIVFRGETLLLDHAGVLVWPRLSLLAVADLHLEKGSACASRGQLVPPWDSAATLGRLAALVQRHAPRVVVAVGDSFHDARAAGRSVLDYSYHLIVSDPDAGGARGRAAARLRAGLHLLQGLHDLRRPDAE